MHKIRIINLLQNLFHQVFSAIILITVQLKLQITTYGLKDMHSVAADNGMITIGVSMTESDPHIKEYPNELQPSYFGRICEDSNNSPHIIPSQDSENKLGHVDCSDGLKHYQCPYDQDIAVDNHVQPYESNLKKYPSITTGSSQNIGRTGQEACEVPENCIPSTENIGKASSQVTTISYSISFMHCFA